jgi:C1A family cysteine protease
MSARYSGWKWDPPHAVSRPTPRLALGAGSANSSSTALLGRMSECYDQGDTGRCVGYSIRRAAQVLLGVDISANCIYSMARCMDRPTPQTKLVDRGSRPFYGMESLMEWGASPEANWPSLAETVNREPDFLQIRSASTVRLEGFQRIDEVGDARVNRYIAAIDAGFPVCYAIFATRKTQENRGEVLEPDGGSIIGGHYMCLLGYEWVNGVLRFISSNSWGSGWGDGGLAISSYDWMKNTMDAYIMDIHLAGK